MLGTVGSIILAHVLNIMCCSVLCSYSWPASADGGGCYHRHGSGRLYAPLPLSNTFYLQGVGKLSSPFLDTLSRYDASRSTAIETTWDQIQTDVG